MEKIALTVVMDVLSVISTTDVFRVVSDLLELTVSYVNRDTREITVVEYTFHTCIHVLSDKLIHLI